MTTDPRGWLRKSMFALARLELVIERFERLEAARGARAAGVPERRANAPVTHGFVAED